MKYRDMNPYLKEPHLTLDIWIPYREKYGWQLRGEELNMARLDGKWELMEEVNETQYFNWSSTFEIILNCTWEVLKGNIIPTQIVNSTEIGIGLPYGKH